MRQSDAAAREAMESDVSDSATMDKIADDRIYKIVKWCKSLPLFRQISVSNLLSRVGFKRKHNKDLTN